VSEQRKFYLGILDSDKGSYLAMALIIMGLATSNWAARAESPQATAIIYAQPLNAGRISPMLFGNFIELLDDVAPGMWAEMLNDRSFEGIAKLSPWCYYDGSPDFCDRPWDTNASWSYDTQDPFNGARCARITAASREPGSLTQSGLAVKKGMIYFFSGHFRADNPALAVSVLLKTRLPNGDWMTLASAKLPPLSQVWRKCSAQMPCKGETDRVVFEVLVKGQGTVWADKLSLMPADNLQGWRRDVVDAIKETHPALVRFGGSVCDPGQYRWKNGIGDRDLRTPFPNKVWGRLDPNDVGVDEFCQFCEVTGVAPLICLSFSDGPQNAADLVEYCNGGAQTGWGAKRAANGHPAPYGVKYWQIGNEISGDDENYLGQFPRFIALLKQADPAVEILSSFPTQKLFDKVGRDIAFVAPHHYTPDLAACERDFNTLARIIDQTPGCAQIKIAVTEWNTSGGDWGLGRGKFLTLDTALRNARYIHVLMRHCDKVKIACRSNMANSFCGAIIETSPSGVLKRPSYYVMQLYARHARPVPLKVKQAKGGPDLFACGSEDGKTVVIFAINSRPEPVNLSWKFDGSGNAVSAEAVCDSQDARQPDVINAWTASDRIKTVALPVESNKVVLPALSATAIECEAK
jgi:alpha-N-arabinofuranosidase